MGVGGSENNVGLTLSVNFSNFDSPLTGVMLIHGGLLKSLDISLLQMISVFVNKGFFEVLSLWSSRFDNCIALEFRDPL